MIKPDLEYLGASTEAAKINEARFWDRMTELGIPEGQAWDALSVVLAEIEGGAGHADPWEVAAGRLATEPTWIPSP